LVDTDTTCSKNHQLRVSGEPSTCQHDTEEGRERDGKFEKSRNDREKYESDLRSIDSLIDYKSGKVEYPKSEEYPCERTKTKDKKVEPLSEEVSG
jgi:hypothetical protein